MVVVMLYLMENFFPNRAPTRFSFDFATRPPIIDGLILLYGPTILDATSTTLNALTWYHIEYQYIDSIILVSINDCQYVTTVNDTLNTYDSSSVQ
ncbi:unnamed protein product [Rotaria sp. Silwood2]|nr:unnamed protein product [Rotaria sp. Silwood2]